MNADKNSKYMARAIATVAAAFVCGLLIHETHGEHGIGWFLIAVCIIW